jgi:hypothetical protein
MKKIIYQIIFILIYLSVFSNVAKSQQFKTNKSNTSDTIHLKGVTISSGFTIDTTVMKILMVLEMQPVGNEPCEYLSFIVLYDNFCGLIFEMGPIINQEKILWASHKDSIIFFSSSIYDNTKLFKQVNQITKYVLENGLREHIGSRAGGYDCLIQNSSDYYLTYNKFFPKNSFLFKKVAKLSDCNLEYYNRSIKKK